MKLTSTTNAATPIDAGSPSSLLLVPFPTAFSQNGALEAFQWVYIGEHDQDAPSLKLILRSGWVRLRQSDSSLVCRMVLTDGISGIHLSIEREMLELERSAADRLDELLAARPAKVRNQRRWIEAGDTRSDMLVWVPSLGDGWLMRLTTLRDGAKTYHVRLWCAFDVYPAWADDFFVAVDSVQLISLCPVPCAEELTQHQVMVGAHNHAVCVQWQFPASWSLQSEYEDVIEAHEAAIGNEGGENALDYPFLPASPRLSTSFILGADTAFGNLHAGLIPRRAADTFDSILALIQNSLSWSDDFGLLEPECNAEGPYVNQNGIQGSYLRFISSSGHSVPAEEPAAGDRSVAALKLDRALHLILYPDSSVWIWTAWMAPATAPLSPYVIGRRAFFWLANGWTNHPQLEAPPLVRLSKKEP